MRPRSGRRPKVFSGDCRMQVEDHWGGILALEAELKFDRIQDFVICLAPVSPINGKTTREV